MARSDFHDVAPDSGGGGEYEFTVTEAYFGISPLYSEKSGRQTLFLHWLGTTNREAQPIMTRDDYHPSFSCGVAEKMDWETLDGGKTAHHPSDKVLHFGAMSKVHELFDRVLGNEENPKTRYTGPALIPEGHPDDPFEDFTDLQADAWVGLKFKMADVEKTFSVPNDNGVGRREITQTYTMPVEFLGKVGGTATAPAPVADAAAPVDVPPAAAAPNAQVIRTRLTGIAKAVDSHEKFTAAAMNIDGVVDVPGLLDEVFAEGPEGFYELARA